MMPSEFPQQTMILGPIHPWLPAAMRLQLDLRGDTVVSSECTFGFLSKSIEKRILNLPAHQAQWIFSRIEPESAMILDRLYSEAVESSVEERGLWIREVTTIASELNSSLKYLAMMAKAFQLKVLSNIILRHREELLDLIELLTGSRYGYYYITPGGTRYDLTEGFAERLDQWLKEYLADFSRIQAMFLWTHSFHNRLRGMGRVVDSGNLGFVSETSVETTRYGTVSQVESRLLHVLGKTESLSLEMNELLARNHANETMGNHLVPHQVKAGKFSSELHTGRGTWKLDLTLSASHLITKIEVTSPSDAIVPSIPLALESEKLEDVPMILRSLNFLVTEVDR
jgi:NADH:ubiquinone oxidoreductase subunit D